VQKKVAVGRLRKAAYWILKNDNLGDGKGEKTWKDLRTQTQASSSDNARGERKGRRLRGVGGGRSLHRRDGPSSSPFSREGGEEWGDFGKTGTCHRLTKMGKKGTVKTESQIRASLCFKKTPGCKVTSRGFKHEHNPKKPEKEGRRGPQECKPRMAAEKSVSTSGRPLGNREWDVKEKSKKI